MVITRMIAAIHQPNFFPWLGYFRKIALADVFVFLDEVQFPKTSKGTWINRTPLLINGTSRWVTCPVIRPHGFSMLKDVSIDERQHWRNKFMRTIKMNYAKTPYFNDVIDWLQPLIMEPTTNLASYTAFIVQNITKRLELSCKFLFQSELKNREVFTNSGSERLASICQEVGADIYLAGDGAKEYETPSTYAARGISLQQSHFIEKQYVQTGLKQFVPGLSILDALFNVGTQKATDLLE